MKRSVKETRKRSAKRDLFAELSEGMNALADARQGKRTLRTHSTEFEPAPTALAKFEAERDVWQEVLDGVREIKAGGGKRTKVKRKSHS